jgi:hypothetical protein
MCYLARQQQTEAEQGRAPALPGSDRVRPRWIGAAVAMTVAGFAVAALTVPMPTQPPVAAAKDPAALAPVVSRSVPVPAAATVETGAASVADDGVPAVTEAANAGVGPCHHGM